MSWGCLPEVSVCENGYKKVGMGHVAMASCKTWWSCCCGANDAPLEERSSLSHDEYGWWYKSGVCLEKTESLYSQDEWT